MEEKKGIALGEIIGYGLIGFFVVKVVAPIGKEWAQKAREVLQKCREAERDRSALQALLNYSNRLAQKNELVQQQIPLPTQVQLPASALRATNGIQKMEASTSSTQSSQTQPALIKPVQSPCDTRWFDVIRHPCRVTVLGGPGSGKTYLIHALAELIHLKFNICLVGFPKEKIHLLPTWMNVTDDLNKVGPDTVAFLDESYLVYPARDSQQKASRELSEPLGLFRQRRQTLVFVAQEARLTDKNIVSSSDMLIIKDPGAMQVEFERPELRGVLVKAKEALNKVEGNKKDWAYIHSPWFTGLLKIPKASYWTEDLSHAYAFSNLTLGERQSSVITLAEKRHEAKKLYATGRYSYQQLAKLFGKKKSTVIHWVKHCK